jgi:hypothetical protein
MREVVTYLPREAGARLMEAYRARRPAELETVPE